MKLRIALTGLLLTLLVLAGIYVYHQYTVSKRNIVAQFVENNNMINILLAGSNEYQDRRHRLFVVLSINPENNNMGLTFVPPSFAVDVNMDGRTEKIGDVAPADFTAVARALGQELDMRIPFYTVLYSPDLSRIVDLVCGVDIFIYEKYKMTHGISFGENYLDGTHLVEYINTTENNSIYDKYDRIMDVVFALYNNRERYRKYLNRPFVELARETVQTNLNTREILSLASFFFDTSGIEWTLLPGKIDASGQYVMDEIAQTVYQESFLKKLVIEEDGEMTVKAKLLNGTRIPGLARKYRTMLMREGVNVVEFGTYENRPLSETLVIDRKGNTREAAYLSELIGAERVYQVIDSTRLHDVLVVLGKDAADRSTEE